MNLLLGSVAVSGGANGRGGGSWCSLGTKKKLLSNFLNQLYTSLYIYIYIYLKKKKTVSPD